MSGLLALNLAKTHGDQLDRIIFGAAAFQLTTPLSPGKLLYILAPLVPALVNYTDLPPVYVDLLLIKYDTNYHWAPTDAIVSFLDFAWYTPKSLAEVMTPTLILQSRNDSTVAPKSAEIIYNGISTPAEQKRIVWFDKTEHEMFRDCERAAITDVITAYVQERIGAK